MVIGFYIFRGSNFWKFYGVFLIRWCMVKCEFKYNIMFSKIDFFFVFLFIKKKDYSVIVFLLLVFVIVFFCWVFL